MKLGTLMRMIAEKTGAVVDIEAIHPAFYHSDKLKLAPDQYLHHGAYCHFAKMEGGFPICAKNKKDSIAIAVKGRSFCGTCPHGIWEMACPVMVDGNLAAVVYLGHFRSAERELHLIAGKKYPGSKLPLITPEKIIELRHYGYFIAEFIALELELLQGDAQTKGKKREEEFYAENCRQFIACKYQEDIGLNDLAETLRVNPNYLGEVIRRNCGQTFREMLNSRRIEESKVYLRLQTNMNISRIALLCGFNDSNYFSVVFHRYSGVTPTVFRQQNPPQNTINNGKMTGK